MKKRKEPYYKLGQKLYIRVNIPDYPSRYYWSVGVIIVGFKNGKYTLKIVDTNLDAVTTLGIPRKYIKKVKGCYFRARKRDLWRRNKNYVLFQDKKEVLI